MLASTTNALALRPPGRPKCPEIPQNPKINSPDVQNPKINIVIWYQVQLGASVETECGAHTDKFSNTKFSNRVAQSTTCTFLRCPKVVHFGVSRQKNVVT